MDKARIKDYKRQLLKLLRQKALKQRRVVLSSGRASNYYLDGRLITLSHAGAHLAASIILDLLKDKKITAVGGPTLGADPLIGAILGLAAIKKRKLTGFIIRKSAKAHGMQRLIEGPRLRRGSRVVLLDDVATSGGSLVEAKKILHAQGVKAVCAIVIVDRQEGAARKLASVGCPLISIFKKKDIL